MRKPIRNIGASVRARLLNLAKERNQPFDLLLMRSRMSVFLSAKDQPTSPRLRPQRRHADDGG